ncbi:MAG: SDR family oxidoreductase [Pelagibacterales bacterium]|nr:SDR family oxidoreductase [Pelagibacterales bacterium]
MNKNILVTGASNGLGLTITATLLKNNYTIYAISRTKSSALIELENKYKNKLVLYSFDLIKNNSIQTELFGDGLIGYKVPLHGFVNNAAIAYDDIVTNLNINKLDEMYKINVYAPLIITKYVIRNMLFNKIKGSIVHLSSISAHTGYKGLSMYASTKGALEAFSKNTSREWGTLDIRSNTVVAGFMETGMSGQLTNEQKNRIYKRTSLKGATDKISVAETISFLLSNKSNSITGQDIYVDAGTI